MPFLFASNDIFITSNGIGSSDHELSGSSVRMKPSSSAANANGMKAKSIAKASKAAISPRMVFLFFINISPCLKDSYIITKNHRKINSI